MDDYRNRSGRISERRIRRDFPLDDLVPGWFFRVDEVSAGVYVAEGNDLQGRTVSKQGFDAEALLRACVQYAQRLQES